MPRNRMASSAENRAGGEAGLPAELRRGEFLAVLRAQGEDFDLPALRAHQQTLLPDVGDRADLALDLAEGAREMFARLEHSQLLAVQERPRRRRRIAAADEVVDLVDVIVPVDLSFRVAAPTLVARLRLVLHRRLGAAADDEIRGLLERLDAHRVQAVEIDRAQRVIGPDRSLLLQEHRTLVESVARPKDREPGARVAANDRPVDGAR